MSLLQCFPDCRMILSKLLWTQVSTADPPLFWVTVMHGNHCKWWWKVQVLLENLWCKILRGPQLLNCHTAKPVQLRRDRWSAQCHVVPKCCMCSIHSMCHLKQTCSAVKTHHSIIVIHQWLSASWILILGLECAACQWKQEETQRSSAANLVKNAISKTFRQRLSFLWKTQKGSLYCR